MTSFIGKIPPSTPPSAIAKGVKHCVIMFKNDITLPLTSLGVEALTVEIRRTLKTALKNPDTAKKKAMKIKKKVMLLQR